MSPSGWDVFQQRVDFIVDGTFANPVVLIPWLGGQIFTPAEQGPDPKRKLRITTGIFVTPGSKLVGEGGQATGGSGGGFNTQVLEQECWLSITLDNMGGDVTYWVQYDRVYFPNWCNTNTDRFYNISYVEDSATLRPNIHLIREHDIASGQGNPAGQVVPTEVDALYFDLLGNRFYRSIASTPPTFTVHDWVPM